MRKAILFILIVPLFISGTLALKIPCSSCRVARDTIILPADTVRAILANAMDTAFTPVQLQLDSSEQVLDSLREVLDSLKQEKGRRKVLGQVDVWTDARGGQHIWRWWYWLFPNGQHRFYKTEKIKEHN